MASSKKLKISKLNLQSFSTGGNQSGHGVTNLNVCGGNLQTILVATCGPPNTTAGPSLETLDEALNLVNMPADTAIIGDGILLENIFHVGGPRPGAEALVVGGDRPGDNNGNGDGTQQANSCGCGPYNTNEQYCIDHNFTIDCPTDWTTLDESMLAGGGWGNCVDSVYYPGCQLEPTFDNTCGFGDTCAAICSPSDGIWDPTCEDSDYCQGDSIWWNCEETQFICETDVQCETTDPSTPEQPCST